MTQENGPETITPLDDRDNTAASPKLLEQVERLKDELRRREERTRYEVSVYTVGEWRPIWRGPSRSEALSAAQAESANRRRAISQSSALGDVGMVRIVGTELVWDDADLVNEARAEIRDPGRSAAVPGSPLDPRLDPRLPR